MVVMCDVVYLSNGGKARKHWVVRERLVVVLAILVVSLVKLLEGYKH